MTNDNALAAAKARRQEAYDIVHGTATSFAEGSASDEVWELLDADSDYIAALEAALTERDRELAAARERVTAAEAIISDVRDTCLSALSYPDAHYSENYIYQAYEPYDDILAIVDPPPENPELEGCYEAWREYTDNRRKGMPFFDYREWKAKWLARQPGGEGA